MAVVVRPTHGAPIAALRPRTTLAQAPPLLALLPSRLRGEVVEVVRAVRPYLRHGVIILGAGVFEVGVKAANVLSPKVKGVPRTSGLANVRLA